MTSTNDGKDVKSNQTSGHKGKTYYIELYKSLEARLSGAGSLSARTGHLCDAWRRVYCLHQHSAHSTHPHLLSWLQRHTALIVLQTEWRDPKSKDEHARLGAAIDSLIAEVSAGAAARPAPLPWEQLLLQRAHWFRDVLENPWGHPVLERLLNPTGEPVTDEQVLEWLTMERGIVFVTRLRTLGAARDCSDLALTLASTVMERARAARPAHGEPAHDAGEAEEDTGPFAATLTREAGFSQDVWDLLVDIEFVLLHKRDKRSRCIDLAKQTPLRNGYQLVERLRSRPETSPNDKKLWKDAKEVATLIAQVIIARCMVVTSCAGPSRSALYCCARSLARLVAPARLPGVTAVLAAPAATARHLHTLCSAMHAQCSEDMMPFVCELYVRAITAGMNELERLKDENKQAEARQSEQMLASWFTQLGALLGGSARLKAECALTAFSVHPAHAMYERVRATPPLAPPADTLDPKPEGSSEFNSWANDSRSQSNLVKTSETLQLKQAPRQANVLSSAILTEGEALGLSVELGQDLVVLLAGPRVKTLLWDMDRELLLENCRAYMERTHAGTRALTTELKYLNLDPQAFQHLPEEEDDENDAYYGIEKGYEHLVQLEQPEEIWQNAFIDPELTESAPESEIESYQLPIKKKNRSTASSDEEDDPLSIISDAKKEKKRLNREKSKERRNKKSHKRDPNKDASKERRKVKDKKPKKERKKNKSDQPAPGSLTSLLGMKVTEMPSQVQDGEKRVRKKKERRRDDASSRVSVTDSDYDSQGKLSQVSDTNEPNMLTEGASVGELKSSDVQKSDDNKKVMDNVSPAVQNDTSVLQNPPITKTKKPPKIRKQPSVNTDASRARSPYLTPNRIASRNVVSSKVRNSITKLLQFRRNKLKAPSVPKSQTQVQQSTSARTHSLIGMKIYNPEGSKIQMTEKQSQYLEKITNDVNNLLNVADQTNTRPDGPKIPCNEPKEIGKLSGLQSVHNAEKQQDMRYSQHNTTQNIVQNSNTFRESHKALSDYMLNTHQKQLQYNNYMTHQPPRPTSVIDSSYISPSKQADRQPHISPPKPPANRLTTQLFHKSMQNLTNNDDLKYDQTKKQVNDVNNYNQYPTMNPQHSPGIQNNACIKSPNVAQNQLANFNSYSMQQHAAVVKAREDVIKFYHSTPENDVRTNQSRGPQASSQVSQSLNSNVIRHGHKHISSLMQDTRTEKYGAGDAARRLQMPNDSRSGQISHTKTYASSHTGEPNAQRSFNTSDNKLQRQVGRIVQNPVKPSPIVRDVTPKQLNIQPQQPMPKLGIDNNFQEFLKELQKSINAGVNAKAEHSVPLNKEVKVSLVNNTSMAASAKKNDLTPPSAKQLIQQKKTENAPNTFSRLSYMHKNKQSEIKLKNDAAALNLELNKNIMEHKISKAKYMKNEVIISRVDKKNTIINDKVKRTTFTKTGQTSSHMQSDFPVLTSILDAKPLETCKQSSKASSTVTHSTSSNSVNREHADLLLLLRNQQTFIAPKAKTNLSTFDLGPSCHTQPKVEKAQVPVATNRTYQRTNDNDIATSYFIDTKRNTNSEEAEGNQQDWKSVMNALKAHTTTPLGPKALDMVLKKERKHSPSSSSAHTSGTKTVNPNSSQSKASDSKRCEHHSSRSCSSSRKPSIERPAEVPKIPNQNEFIKMTPEVSKITEVPNKHFTSNPLKQDDPFISGIPNSDYDLLEELMDDDLRQEIGELSSDEEYRAPVVSAKGEAPCSDSKTNACAKLADVPKEKPRTIDLKTVLSNNAPDYKKMETNCTRTAVNTSSQTSYTNVITYHPVKSNTTNLPESRPTVLCSNMNDQHTSNVITNYTEPHHYVANISSNTRMEPTNLIITSVPAQPMVLISQELVYDPYPTIRIHENQVNAGLCSITQNAYVAVNTAPNIAVYQTTQFAAPVINPVIIGNAMTTTTNVTNALSNENQDVKHEEKTAGMPEKTSPIVDTKMKDDSDIAVDKSINFDLTLNKNNERKVLSQVQENNTNDVSDKDLRSLRLSVDRNPIKTKQDEERLKMKRQSLMNREVKHPRHPPIPLSYTPLGKKVNVNKLLLGPPKNGTVKSNYEMLSKIVEDRKDTLVTSVESPKSETNNENIENPDQILSAKENNKVCRRILLRSSNTLEKKSTPSKNVRIPLRRNKVKLKVAELGVKVASSSDGQKNNDITTNDTITRKRISKRLMDKKLKDEAAEPNTALSLEINKNQEASLKNIDIKEMPDVKLIDFENELSGSKILKVPVTPNANNAQQALDKDMEKAETPTVIENILEENNKNPAFLGSNKATPIQNTAVPTVLIEKLKDNLGGQLVIKSTSVAKSAKQPIVMTIKNKKETILSINSKEASKQICDKSDNTVVKTAAATKTTSELPAVPALHIKLNSSGPVILNDNKLKTRQPEPVVVDDNKIKVKTTQPEPVIIDDKQLKVTITHPEPIVVDDNKLKAMTKQTEPIIVDGKKLKAKAQKSESAVTGNEKNIKQAEPIIVDGKKLKAKAKKSESAVTGNEKNMKQSEPVTVDDSKIKASVKQSEPVLVANEKVKVKIDDSKIKARVKQSEPDLVANEKVKVRIDDSKIKASVKQSEPVLVANEKVEVKIDDSKIKASVKESEPVLIVNEKVKVKIDDNKIKASVKQSEPVLVANEKVKVKIKPTELAIVDGNKIKLNVNQSEPVIVGDDKLKATETQCSPVVDGDNKLNAKKKPCAPVVIIESNQSIINNMSSKDETSEQPENITENLDLSQRLPTKEISKNKGSVPLPETTSDKAVPIVAEIKNNNNRHLITVNEKSSLMEQKATDVHSKKVTVNDTAVIVNSPEELKNGVLNQTPIVSNLINNSNSVNENVLLHKKIDTALKNHHNDQKAIKSLKDKPDNRQDNVARFRKEDYIIEEIPIKENDDPNKKCVRIKLPNGKVFKATVFGKKHVDYDTLFADPAMKNVLAQSLTEGKRYTLNIKQVCTTQKNNPDKLLGTTIEGIDVIEKKKEDTPIDTVNLISDDEDEDTRSFSTEFGKYNTKIDVATFTKHQKKFVQKCVVKLSRDNVFKSNRTKPKPRSRPWPANSLLTRTKSKLLSQEQNRRSVVLDVPPINTKEDATAASLESSEQTINTQATNALLTRTQSKLLSKEKNVSCVVPDIQPSPNSTEQDLPAVNFESSEQPIKPALPTPLILKRVTQDRNVFNSSEVIEIDDSSNDSIEIGSNENIEPVKKIIELKSLLLQDLGVASSDNVSIKGNVVIPGNIDAVENLKNALLEDLGVADTTKKLHNVVTEQKEGPKDDQIKTTVLLMKECLVKVSKCDDLVKKYELIKRAKECFVLVQKCDVLPVKADLKLRENPREKETAESAVDYGEDFIDFDIEEDSFSPKLSRCPSLSILNLWDDTICQPTTETLYGRSSPVMEIFEALASLYSKCIHENIIEENIQLLPITCCSEWMKTKVTYRIQETTEFSNQLETKGEEIINTCHYNPEVDGNALVIFKAPKLVDIALKCLENSDVVYRLGVACDARKKSSNVPPNNLKRKTETSDDKVASKILKLETLALKAINTYDGDFFGAKIAKSTEVIPTLDVTQNVTNGRIGNSPEFKTEANKSIEGVQYKIQNFSSEAVRHVNQDKENVSCLSTQKLKLMTDNNEEKPELEEKMASNDKDALGTKLSEPTCVGAAFVTILANDSNVANIAVENEIVTMESEECSKTDNYEIQTQPEKSTKDGLDIRLNRENYSKTYSDLENKLASNDVTFINEHCTENISNDYIDSNGPRTLQMKLKSEDEHCLKSKSAYVPSTTATDPLVETDPPVETDPIENTDTEINSIVEDIINCLLHRCDETEKAIDRDLTITEIQKTIGMIASDTDPSCDMASNLLKDNNSSSVLIDDSTLAIDKSDMEEFENSMPCKENIDELNCTNKEDFETKSNITLKQNQPDDSAVLLCQSSKEGDSELLELEFKEAVTDTHYQNLKTEEEIIQEEDFETKSNITQKNNQADDSAVLLCQSSQVGDSEELLELEFKQAVTKTHYHNLKTEEETGQEEDFETMSNITQKKNQPDDSAVLLCETPKDGDSELLELEFKQAVTETHYHNLKTEEEIVQNCPNVNQTSESSLLCVISADDIPKQGCEVEIVDTSYEEDTEIVHNANEVISCESATENHDSSIKSPLVVDNKEIFFNYHDYTKPPKIKDIPIVNSEELGNYCTPDHDSQVLTDDVSLTVNVANRSTCDQLKKSTSPKIETKENFNKEEPSNNDLPHKIVASSDVKGKPEFKYEFIQEDDWLTVITTENEKDTTTSGTEITSSNLKVSTVDQEIVSPVSTEDSGVTIKGIEYEDPVMGKCYVFTLNESGSSTSNISSDNLEVFQESDSSQDANEFKDPYEDLHNIEFCVIMPKVTYCKGSLKRKKNMRDFYVLESKYRKNNERDRKIIEKKYRKGKNIDCPKQTLKSIIDSAYAKEFNRLFEYYSSLKFSLSRPFPRDYLDVSDMLSNWPVAATCTEIPSNGGGGGNLFDDLQPTTSYQPDPATQTLAEEITYQYQKMDALQENKLNEASDTNFNMGFGEGSGRVIQNLKKGGVSNISAATLSDVKQSQPFLVCEDYDDYETLKTNTDDQLKKIRQYVNFIELRDKVRSFFKKTTVELKSDWIQHNKAKHNDKLRDFPFDLCSLDYVRPAPSEVVVQVVQVGQLPVSAAAQNPVTCDPRVTQVSDASPSQCSVDNSPNDDSQSEIKTEYTELTTADLTLPLVQEYAQQNQVMNQDSHDVNDIEITEQTISLEMEIKAEERPEIKQEMPDITEERSNSADNTDMHTYTNTTPEHVEYSFENNTAKPDGNNVNYDAAEKNNSETFTQQRQQNGTSEKTDQIAHAMNAAGITTTPESINNSRAHALVNILSQKIRQSSVNTTQTNTYSKTTSINAMSLQQALAQILPPPLNQTGSGENNQTGSTPVGPQVLHIVQGKNASGNQITLVDNSQQSVISNPNATQVLHIVQNKGATSGQTSNGTLTSQSNSFSGLSLVDTGLQQGGNQLLHIVNTGNQKNASPGQLLKRVNLLTNLANVQGSNEQKMVQFVCKSADGKAIQLNAPHQRSMVLRLQPIETPNVHAPPAKPAESQDLSPSPTSSASSKEAASQQEIKSRSIYEENYAKFIQNSSSKTPSLEKSTSLPKFNQAFGKPVFQEGNQKQGEAASSNTHIQPVSTNNEPTECHASDNAINLEHIGQISSPPLLLRKQPAATTQSPSNLVQQIKQTISPMNIQTMHGGVIYTRQIPVNIGGGQTINLITVPSTELINEDTPKPQTANQGEIEPSIIKIVPQSQATTNSEGSQEDNNSHTNSSSENAQNPQPQPVLTQMRIKLPMLSKAPQMVPGARVVRPSFFQIQRNVIGGANQPVYQQLVLTAAPPLGQQTIRLPQAQASRPIKVASENQSSSESQMSSSTLEQLREFDMVLEQVKERSTVQPSSNSNNNSFKLHTNSSDATDGTGSSNCSNESTQQQVLYSIGNNQSLNVAYVNRKATVTTPTTSTYVRSPDSTGIADSPTSSTHVQIPHTVTTDSSPTETAQPKPAKVGSKSKSRPKSSSNPPNTLKLNSSSSVPPKTSSQKPLEDEQTTQRILYILAEYKEQVENSPDKDKPAPRRRSNPPSNPGSSKRKKSSSSRRSGTRDMSPVHGEDTCRTMGSEDSSCGTSQGDCTESCLDSHSPQDSPRKVARKITFDQELPAQARPQPQRNVIVADGQTITVARGTTGKPATAVLMPANYILPVSMVKGGQQIAIVTNRGPKLLTVGGEGGAANALLLQRLIGPGGLKPVLARPGVRHVRLPTAALHNLQAFNLATGAATSVQPPDSTASPTPGPTPPELVDTRATSSPWTDRDEVKPERGSSPEGSEPWNLPSSADAHEYSYEETVRTDNMDRTVLVVQKKDGTQRQHRLSHVSAAALRHKYAILEHELRLQKSLSEECEDLGVDSPSASELFPEAELLFAASPAHDHNQEQHHSHTPQPLQSTIPQPDIDDQIATDHLIPREIDVSLGLGDVGIVAVSEDGVQATIALDQEEFARAHPNTTFHSEPTDAEAQPFTITGLKGRHITSTIFHSNSAPATVLMAAPQATVISQAPESVKYEIENMINMPSSHNNDVNLSSVLVKDDGLTRFDNILTDSRELHLTNTTSAIVHSSGNATQVIRRVCYEDDKRERDSRFLIDEPDNVIAGDDAKMIAEDSSRDATLESMADVDDDRSSPERHAELFWESNSASERSESRRPLDFSSDSDKCCKSPSFDETNSTDSSGVGTHMRLDSVIKEARGRERSGSADGSSADDTHPPLRTYPPKRLYHPMEGEVERSLSGKTRAGERSPDSLEVRRRASGRGVVKRGCHCCNGSPAPPRPKKPRQRKPTLDFNSTN